MPSATFIRQLPDFTGDARLYRVDPPLTYEDYDDDFNEVERTADYVIVSAASPMWGGPETYIFPASEHGEVVDWSELPGSIRGSFDHVRALYSAGYEVTANA